MAYPNLEAEIARAGLNKQKLAKKLGVSGQTVYNWTSGRRELSLKKCREIKETIGTDVPIEVLFAEA